MLILSYFDMIFCVESSRKSAGLVTSSKRILSADDFKASLKNDTTVELTDPVTITLSLDNQVWFSDTLVGLKVYGKGEATLVTIECEDEKVKSFSLFNSLENAVFSNVYFKLITKNGAKLQVEKKSFIFSKVVSSFFSIIQLTLPNDIIIDSTAEASGILVNNVVSSTMLEVAVFFGKLKTESLSSLMFGTVSKGSYIGNAIVQGKNLELDECQYFGIISGIVSTSIIADSIVDMGNITINIETPSLIKRSIGMSVGSLTSVSKIFNTVVIVRDLMKVRGITMNMGMLAGKIENSQINNCFTKVTIDELLHYNNANYSDSVTIGALVGEIIHNYDEDKVMMVNNYGLVNITAKISSSSDEVSSLIKKYGLYIGKINRGTIQIVNSYILLALSEEIKNKVEVHDMFINNNDNYINYEVEDAYYIIRPNEKEVTLHSRVTQYINEGNPSDILKIVDKLKNYENSFSDFAYYKHTPKWTDASKVLGNLEINSQQNILFSNNNANKEYNYEFKSTSRMYCSSPLNIRNAASHINDYPDTKYEIYCIQVYANDDFVINPKGTIPDWMKITGYDNSVKNDVLKPPAVNIYTIDMKEDHEGVADSTIEMEFLSEANSYFSQNYFRYNNLNEKKTALKIEPLLLKFGSIELIPLNYTVKLDKKPTSPVTIEPIIAFDQYTITPTKAELNEDNSYKQIFTITPKEVLETTVFIITHAISTTDESYSNRAEVEIPELRLQTILQENTTAPEVVSIKESPSAFEILIEFDLPCYYDNDNIIFECDSLLNIDTILLSSIENCIWRYNNTIAIILKNDTVILPDTVISIKPDKIKSSENNINSAISEDLTIQLRPPVPQVVESRFKDGSKINITFNTAIEEGISAYGVNCSSIFNETDSIGGENVKCYLENDMNIIIALPNYESEIVPGDELVIKGGILRSAVNHLYSMPETIIKILPPNPIPTLTPVIDSQDKVLYCKKLTLDGSSSSGCPGRPLTYTWSLLNPSNDTISAYLENKNTPVIEFPSFFFVLGIYKFQLKIKSFLSETEEVKTKEITITDIPFVNTKVDKDTIVYVGQLIFIKSKVTYEYCENDKSHTNNDTPLKYEWKIDDKEVDKTKFTTTDPTRIGVNGSALELGTYILKITGSKGEGVEPSSDTCKVTIKVKNLEIEPACPLIQTIFSNETLLIGVKETGNLEKITYKWSSTSFNFTKHNEIEIDKQTLTIEGNILEIKNQYTFILEAKGAKSGQTKKFKFTVNVKDPSELIVNIVNDIHPSNVFTLSDIIILTAKITNLQGESYIIKWLYLDNSEISPFASQRDRASVYIDCSVLSPYTSHTIEVKLTSNDRVATNKYVFTISLPPEGGYIVVPKISHYEFGSKYTITTTGWSSNIEPLSYRFGVYKDNTLYYLQSVYGTSQSYNGILPFGSVYDNYTLIPVVFVQDASGGIVNTTLTENGKVVKIYAPPVSNETQLKATLNKTLNDLIIEQDFDQMYSLIGSISDQYKQGGCEGKCQNDGVCEEYICRCNEGYYGIYCENHYPIDGGWSEDYYYGECIKGKRLRYKICNNPVPQYGGKNCGKINYVNITCSSSDDSQCSYSEWSDWSKCIAECDAYNGDTIKGTQTRSKALINKDNTKCLNISESKDCDYKCDSPVKLCPGQVLTNEGKVTGKECYGKGTCSRSRENCKENEPTCLSYCICNPDFYGDDCSKTQVEFENSQKIKQQLIDSLNKAFENSAKTSDAMQQQSSTILSVIDPPSDLHETAKNDSFNIIKQSIEVLHADKPKSVSYEALSNYIKASSILLKDEWTNNAKKRLRRRRNLDNSNDDKEDTTIGNQITSIIDDIAMIHKSQDYSPPLTVDTDIVSLNLVRADPTYNYNQMVEVTGAIADVNGALTGNGGEEIQVMNWADNPKGFDSESLKRESGILSIKITGANGNNRNDSFRKPVLFTNKVNSNTKLRDIRCTYYDGNELSSKGVVVLGLIEENGEKLVLCSANHLTDFTAQLKAVIPKMNFVNPVSDAHLLGNYNKSNMIVPIILGVILVICISLWFYSKYRDFSEINSVTEEKATRFLKYGYLVNKNEGLEEIKANKGKQSIWQMYKQKLTHTHTWLAPEFKTIDELIVVNRSQHILCLTAQVLTSLAVNALFFGNNSENIGQLIMTSIISTLVMLPCTVIIPLIYKYANGYKSRTVKKRTSFSIKRVITRVKTIFASLSTANKALYKLQVSLYIMTGIFDLISAIFFITFMIILPQGYMTLILVCFFLVFIVETVACFFATGTQNKRYFLYLFCINLVFTIFFAFIFIFYIIGMSSPDSITSDIWNGFYQLPGLKDLLSYAEGILNCCGYNDPLDHNINECSSKDQISYLHGEDVGCKDLLHNKLVQFAPAWLLYFVISLIILIPKLVVLFKYLTYKFNCIIPNPDDDNIYYHQKEALEKITCLFRKRLFVMRFHREREYVTWTRQRRLRSSVVMLANVFVFLYILIMIYINLLYGVKFESNMATKWIISSVISVMISLIVQEPSLILLNTVATSTLGAAFRI